MRKPKTKIKPAGPEPRRFEIDKEGLTAELDPETGEVLNINAIREDLLALDAGSWRGVHSRVCGVKPKGRGREAQVEAFLAIIVESAKQLVASGEDLGEEPPPKEPAEEAPETVESEAVEEQPEPEATEPDPPDENPVEMNADPLEPATDLPAGWKGRYEHTYKGQRYSLTVAALDLYEVRLGGFRFGTYSSPTAAAEEVVGRKGGVSGPSFWGCPSLRGRGKKAIGVDPWTVLAVLVSQEKVDPEAFRQAVLSATDRAQTDEEKAIVEMVRGAVPEIVDEARKARLQAEVDRILAEMREEAGS